MNEQLKDKICAQYRKIYEALLERPFLILITGASGVGKTTILKMLEETLPSKGVSYNYFDSIGVPSEQEMIKQYGTVQKWQEAMTQFWIERLLSEVDKKLIFLEGSFNPEYAISVLENRQLKNYQLICLGADRSTREGRLINFRQQPELVHENMQGWADFLKKKTKVLGGMYIDTTKCEPIEVIDQILDAIIT